MDEKGDSDEDDDSDLAVMVPFQKHMRFQSIKLKGLEYDSVKVVITEEIDQMITHNIFYTAIMRAKIGLKLESGVTTKSVISSFVKMNAKYDATIFAAQTKIKMVKSRESSVRK